MAKSSMLAAPNVWIALPLVLVLLMILMAMVMAMIKKVKITRLCTAEL